VSSDDHDLLLRAALDGVGLAYVWEDRAEAHVRDGRLIRCLDSWCAPEDWLYLYYPTRKYISAGLRAVIEAMRA
jgi:DNA-binding transcriptional LysR family regulator